MSLLPHMLTRPANWPPRTARGLLGPSKFRTASALWDLAAAPLRAGLGRWERLAMLASRPRPPRDIFRAPLCFREAYTEVPSMSAIALLAARPIIGQLEARE